MDQDSICRLANADPRNWRGLEITQDRLPACLGAVLEQGSRRFPGGILAAARHRPDTGQTEVDAYWWMNGGQVELLDVHPTNPLPAEPLLADLGAPEETHRYSDEELDSWDLVVPPHGSIDEAIYSSRGLALTLGLDDAGRQSVIRLRGFRPMSADRYVRDLVASTIESLE